MIILGINAYHGDSAACLVKDGLLICALEEERIRRVKHWSGFPSESIKWCLSYAGIDAKDVDYVAVNRDPLARMHLKLFNVLKRGVSREFFARRLENYSKISRIKTSLAGIYNLSYSGIKAKVINVEHHKAHVAGSFFVSPFKQAAFASIDGFGDFASTTIGLADGNRISVKGEVIFPNSLGIFYSALTQFLGFWNYGDEYKIMGLCAYGKPVYADKLKKIIRFKKDGLFELDSSYFLHDKNSVDMTWLNGYPTIGRLFSDKLINLLGEQRGESQNIDERFQNLAASLQWVYESAFFHILNNLYKKTKLENLVLSGGCIQNSLANGKIYERTSFKNVYIPPAAHDAGGCIGAAYYVWNKILGQPKKFVLDSAYLGPDYSDNNIKDLLNELNLEYEYLKEEELIKRAAGYIVNGKIIGWFQGWTEWGPRALGNRSILVDPRREEMKEILNARIKKREWFRPFAPSILEDKVGEWFENAEPVPFMEKVYKIKEEKRSAIPAVCHSDGTGRLQTVKERINPRYYSLIKEFAVLTGVPIILNTSFNENEPIVNTPLEAIQCFLKTGVDLLVIGNYIVNQS